MRFLALLTTFLLLQACKHPLAIEGEGDIIERLIGHRGCSLEEFQAGAARCAENEALDEDYMVSYEAIPRPGWRFLRWEGGTPCSPDSVEPYCDFDVASDIVNLTDELSPDTVLPATVAVFVENTLINLSVGAQANGGFGPVLGGLLEKPARRKMVAAVQLVAGQTAILTAVGEINIATTSAMGVFVSPDGEDFSATLRPTPFYYFPLEEVLVDAGELVVPITGVALTDVGALIGAFVAQKAVDSKKFKALNDDPDPDLDNFITPRAVAGGISSESLFVVGSGPFAFTAPRNGTFFLGINDADTSNNAGKFSVSITIE